MVIASSLSQSQSAWSALGILGGDYQPEPGSNHHQHYQHDHIHLGGSNDIMIMIIFMIIIMVIFMMISMINFMIIILSIFTWEVAMT